MNNRQYNLQFEKLVNLLQLGDLVSMPEPLSGGFLNKMFAVQTTKRKYALKAINPQIMLRPEAMENYINSEMIANIAAKSIPAVPAIMFDGKSLQEIDGQFYLIFDWVEGKILKQNEVTITHCEKIGRLLASIHKTNFSEKLQIRDDVHVEQLADWNFYLLKGEKCKAKWAGLLRENLEDIYVWNNQAIISAKLLAGNSIISHRDLDLKNVLWHNGNPFIIDWEAAGSINQYHDLIDTAIYWSMDETESIDKNKFFSFINSYKSQYSKLNADWKSVLRRGFSGKLGWLEYSIKRSLGIECIDEAEQRMGSEQVIETIKDLINYSSKIEIIEEWLLDLQ